jgi:hypothetical protein
MLRIYQLQRSTAVFVATVFYAGLLVEVAGAQTPTGCNPTITGPNGTCSSSTTVTKPVPAADGTTVAKTTTTQ